MEHQDATRHTSKMTELSPVKQALLEIRNLRSQLEEIEQVRTEPIAIIGMGCRLPGGVQNPEQFWHLLKHEVDAITEVPGDRWQNAQYYHPEPQPGKISTRWGGFLEKIDLFDPQFFGIAPREAAAMDPQQRLLLEVSWEALEQAGQSPDQLLGSQTGVFVGIASIDYGHLLLSQAPADIDAYLGVGFAHSIAAGRLAYVLGTQGPTVAIDTACSSSLVAVHQAVQNLRSGACQMALVGGVNVILLPEVGITFSQAQMLSKDGRCKTFDAGADGYVRSEGCGVVVLKRLSDAIANRDQVLAVIRGTAINHDGRSNGISAPNGLAQAAVIQAALTDARLQPEQVSYVEAHGTGTSLGDPIEVHALNAALCQERSPTHPLLIGSAKTNIGHLEAAAGIAGLIKAVLALQHRQIPPTLHLQQINPHIDWQTMPISVPRQLTPFPSQGNRSIAGVSSFGFSGTNAHVVLEAAPAPVVKPLAIDRPLHLFTLSAKREADLLTLVERYQQYLATPSETLADVCFTANAGRSHLTHRLAVITSTAADLQQQLSALQSGEVHFVQTGQVFEATPPEITFVFGGEGISINLAQELFQTQPQFRSMLEHCDRLLQPYLERSLLSVLYPVAGEPNLLLQQPYAQSALFAVEYALATLWRSWGVEPTLVLGEGVGEWVAACVAGVFSLEEGLKLASSPQPAAIAEVAPPQIGLISALTGNLLTAAELVQPDYWQQQRPPLSGVLSSLTQPGLFLEISPSPLLSKTGSRILPRSVWLPSLQLDRSEWQSLLESLAALYVRGVPIDWTAFDQDYPRSRVALPTYPWARERYWIAQSQPSSQIKGDRLWQAIVTAGQQQSQQGPLDLALETFTTKWSCLDQITHAYILQTLQAFSVFTQKDDCYSVDQVLAQCNILPTYRPLLLRWLKHLVATTLVQQQGKDFVSSQPLPHASLEAAKQQARQTLVAEPILLDYVERCGDRLSAILTGQASPLDTLFPNGSYETAEYLYRDWSLIRYFSSIVRQVVTAIAQNSTCSQLRILEIGAGTGGTASVLLPVLPTQRTHYQFTDVSDFFLNRAAQRLSDYPFVHYSLLDIEQDPVTQGYTPASFDLIIAANVLHATHNLRETVAHVRSLLAPGGVLVLFEVTQHLSWFDITTGLIEGWERFGDDLRQDDPLLSVTQWQALLQTSGFEQVTHYPEAASPPEILGSHVIVAQVPLGATQTVLEPISNSQPLVTFSLSLPPAAPNAALPETLRQQLAVALPDERREQLTAFVREQVASVLRAPAATLNPRHRLMDIGVDSLMAVELRNRLQTGLGLGQTIPATLMFDYPTIAAIADHLNTLLQQAESPASLDACLPELELSEPGLSEPERSESAVAIEQLSDTEVEALLLEKLSRLEY